MFTCPTCYLLSTLQIWLIRMEHLHKISENHPNFFFLLYERLYNDNVKTFIRTQKVSRYCFQFVRSGLVTSGWFRLLSVNQTSSKILVCTVVISLNKNYAIYQFFKVQYMSWRHPKTPSVEPCNGKSST